MLLTWFARCWLGNVHDRSTACKTEDGRHRRPSRGLYLFMMLFCPGESRRKSLFVLRSWLRYIHIIMYNNFILCTYPDPMFAIDGGVGGVGREITNRKCYGPVSKFFASGTFFRPDWTRHRQWRSSSTYIPIVIRRADLRNNVTSSPPALVNNYKLSLSV